MKADHPASKDLAMPQVHTMPTSAQLGGEPGGPVDAKLAATCRTYQLLSDWTEIVNCHLAIIDQELH